MRLSIGLLGVVAALGLSAGPALAQKSGGTLKMYIADNPPSTSIHEEATTSTVVAFGVLAAIAASDFADPDDLAVLAWLALGESLV